MDFSPLAAAVDERDYVLVREYARSKGKCMLGEITNDTLPNALPLEILIHRSACHWWKVGEPDPKI